MGNTPSSLGMSGIVINSFLFSEILGAAQRPGTAGRQSCSPRHHQPVLSQPLGSAGTGACSSALSARHGDRPQTSQQHQCLPRQSGTGIGRGYCLEWGDHVSVSPSPPWPGRAVECHRKSAYKGRGKIKIDPVAAWCARSRARLAKGQCLSPALSCSLVDGITGVF